MGQPEPDYYERAKASENRKKRDKRAFQARLRAEQAEARALGVAVVEKLTLDNKWTEAEHDVLRALYPDLAMIQSRLPGRNLTAIKQRCQHLGIQQKRPGYATWTVAEMARLRKLYSTVTLAELNAAFPGKTSEQLQSKAGHMKLYRPKAAPVSTGNPLCDAIRQRAFALGYTMGDLDRMAATKRYFTTGEWRSRGHTMANMTKAVHALGGTVTADWGDDE